MFFVREFISNYRRILDVPFNIQGIMKGKIHGQNFTWVSSGKESLQIVINTFGLKPVGSEDIIDEIKEKPPLF